MAGHLDILPTLNEGDSYEDGMAVLSVGSCCCQLTSLFNSQANRACTALIMMGLPAFHLPNIDPPRSEYKRRKYSYVEPRA
jgi:hypothetical protein